MIKEQLRPRMEVFREKKFTPTSNALLETQKPSKLKFSLSANFSGFLSKVLKMLNESWF